MFDCGGKSILADAALRACAPATVRFFFTGAGARVLGFVARRDMAESGRGSHQRSAHLLHVSLTSRSDA